MCINFNIGIPARVFPALALMLLCTSAAVPAPDEPHRVLVMHSFRNSLPVNTDWYNGLVRGFTMATDLRIEIDIEAPDLTNFKDTGYINNLLGIYRHKYRDQRPHLIIPTYTPALKFLLDHGEGLFPGIPVVFLGADNRFVNAQRLAPHITGITTHPDIAGTLELALHVHPGTQRVAVIVGSGSMDKLFERDARQAFQSFEGRVDITWLQGMPLAELAEVVQQLPDQTVILYLIQLQDRTGKTYVPFNTLHTLSRATNVPIYGLWDTLLEHGITGGRLGTMEGDGFQAAQMALRILRGEAPAAVPVVNREGNNAIFHGQELARWNINDSRLPAGSRILHRQLPFWEEHKTEIIIAGLVIGTQGLLIVSLLLSRARLQRTKAALQSECDQREQAEAVTRSQRRRLARFYKERTLGAMVTGIAHEINQPLIAIQNYAQAAIRRLQSNTEQTSKLNELLEKIEQQTSRAGDIIQHVRTLVTTEQSELLPVSLYSILEQVIQMTKAEIGINGCSLDYRPTDDLPVVLADELQVQLVLINLLRNAMQSMQSMADKPGKVISIAIQPINDRKVQVSVTDQGPGIPPDKAADIFEPFYSDKLDGMGMGMGLTICRTIIEVHGGQIGYTPNPSGGARFHFTLQLAKV